MMDHSINLTHDGTLILRIPKGYKVDKVVVEEMGTENRKKFVHMPADISDYCDELWDKAYERGKAEGHAESIRCKDCKYQDKGQNESESWNQCGYRPWQYIPTDDEHYCGHAELRGEVNE